MGVGSSSRWRDISSMGGSPARPNSLCAHHARTCASCAHQPGFDGRLSRPLHSREMRAGGAVTSEWGGRARRRGHPGAAQAALRTMKRARAMRLSYGFKGMQPMRRPATFLSSATCSWGGEWGGVALGSSTLARPPCVRGGTALARAGDVACMHAWDVRCESACRRDRVPPCVRVSPARLSCAAAGGA